MAVRSLPHFAHKPIGKTTHQKGFSYSHVNYITRPEACSHTLAENMPDTREGARPYFTAQAYQDGVPSNARIADTLIIALPLELTREQRHEVVATFMAKIGQGRIAWFAAFHDMGKDEDNPHCHLILRDADIDTGRKVLGTTTSAKDVKEAEEKGWKVPPRMTTKDLRVAWCDHLNGEMERLGHEARFDQRSLKEQGIDRERQIHVGPKANSMAKKGRAFESYDRLRADHANVYTLLDAGSRAEHNERIKERNQQREAGNDNAAKLREGPEKKALRERQAAERKAMYQEQRRDRAALRESQDARKLEHQRWGRALYAAARQQAYVETKAVFQAKWQEIRTIKDRDANSKAAEALKLEQAEARKAAAERHIEHTRPHKNATWETLKSQQEQERQQLRLRQDQETSALARQHMCERHALHERWQHKEAAKTNARLDGQQGMAKVQANAIKMIKLHAAAKRLNGGDLHPQAAQLTLDAARKLEEQANYEKGIRDRVRSELSGERQQNLFRAASPAERRSQPGRMEEVRTEHRAKLNLQRVRSAGRKLKRDASRKSFKDVSKASGRTSAEIIREQAQFDATMQQAAKSGRPLTDAELASASPDAKAARAAKAKTAKERREEMFDALIRRQQEGKSRDGGRSGR